MSLTARQQKALNDWGLFDPALRGNSLIGDDAILFGDLMQEALVQEYSSLDALLNVDLTTIPPISGQSLEFNGTNWVAATIAGSGDVVGPGTSVVNSISYFADASGDLINDAAGILIGGSERNLEFVTIASGSSVIDFQNNASSSQATITHDSATGTFAVSTSLPVTLESTASTVDINSSGAVRFNTNSYFSADGRDLVMSTNLGSETVGLDFVDSGSTTVFELEYRNMTDDSHVLTSKNFTWTTTGGALYTYDLQGGNDASVILNFGQSGSNPGSVDFFSGSRDPSNSVTAKPGSIYYRENGANSTIYFHKGTISSNTDWFDIVSNAEDGNVTTSATLSDNFLVRGNGTNDIDIAGAGTDGVFVDSTSTKLSIRPSNDDTVAFELQDSIGSSVVELSFNDNTNSASMSSVRSFDFSGSDDAQFITTNTLTLGSSSGSVHCDFDTAMQINHANNDDTATTLLINQQGTNAGNLRFHVGDRDPRATVSAVPNSLYSREDTSDSDLLLNIGVTSNNDRWVSIVAASTLVFGEIDGVGTDATAKYLVPGNGTGDHTTEFALPAPRAGILRNLFVRQNTAGTGAQTLTYTVKINDIDSALTADLLSTATQASDTAFANYVEVNQGDRISLLVTKSGGPTTSPLNIVASLEFLG